MINRRGHQDIRASKKTAVRGFTPRGQKPTLRGAKAPQGTRPSKPVTRMSPQSAPRPPQRPKKVLTPKPPRTARSSAPTVIPTASWGQVASWYASHLEKGDTYHSTVILPNLLRLVNPRRGDEILDMACGTGFFSTAFAKEGAQVTGIDVGEELIAHARTQHPAVSYHVSSATKASIVSTASKQKVTIVLAIQNIEDVPAVCNEAFRILRAGGTFHLVMNHPAFRVPKRSSWEYDEKQKVQYRRIDGYLSESSESIVMHPGMMNSPETISFHRPLQYFVKALTKAGFLINRLEEWNSDRESNSGPRAKAENNARKEIPLFLYISALKPER